MNLSDVISYMAEKTCRPETEARRAAHAFLDAVREGLARNQRVELCGFGILHHVQMPDRMARNFATGEAIPVKGKRKVRFTASRSLPTGRRSPYDWRSRAAAEQAQPAE